MTDGQDSASDYDEAGVARIRAFVEKVTGGRITKLDRQVRWRPAWFADVEKDGVTTALHLRGDRTGDVAIFPDLKREADIIEILYNHGVPVPKVYGYCVDPPCIVMDALPGTRDMADAADDATRMAIGRDYMAAVALMHSLPLDDFVAAGMDRPETAEDIALVGLRAYMPLYLRTKSKPEPLLEFLIGWLKRNVPTHRNKAAFIQFDSGQFHLKDGKMTGLYDFEFSMIGDPMVDIATMAMRDSVEPLGSPLADLCRHYEAVSVELVDEGAVMFHILQFATLGTMQFAGTLGKPVAGDPHAVYLLFDLALRQVILRALTKLLGAEAPTLAPLPESDGRNAALIAQLADTVAGIQGAEPIDDDRKTQARDLIEWLSHSDRMGGRAQMRDLADVSAYLGNDFDDWAVAEAALEARVQQAGQDQDVALFHLFSKLEGRRMQMWGDTAIGHSAQHVTLPPTH
ncbi:MAG: aminoglycoside phosphotransferase [Sphingomonadales bacterium]|nr:aminoglycoside phosphotransferase [Sphingomonadales bacterium]